jgi:hypothetical protein
MVPLHGQVDAGVGKKNGLDARSLSRKPAATSRTRAPE